MGLGLLLDSGPIGRGAVAGTVLVALSGIVAPAGYWLRMHPASGGRARLLPTWVGSRAAVATAGFLGLAAMVGGGIVAGEATHLGLGWSDERVALIVLAVGIALLGSTLWATWIRWIRRRFLARSPS